MGAGDNGQAPTSSWFMSSDRVSLVGAVAEVSEVYDPMVTGVGSMLVTCFLLVLHLLPVQALKTLSMNSSVLSMCNSFNH